MGPFQDIIDREARRWLQRRGHTPIAHSHSIYMNIIYVCAFRFYLCHSSTASFRDRGNKLAQEIVSYNHT